MQIVHILTIDQIREALADRRPHMIAEATGLHTNTIREIRDNPDANPTYATMLALSRYLSAKQE